MASAWFDAWGEAWGDSWGATVSGALTISGVGDIASAEAFGGPYVNKRLHYNQAPLPIEVLPALRPLRIIGVGNIRSAESVGRPRILEDDNELIFLLLAA